MKVRRNVEPTAAAAAPASAAAAPAPAAAAPASAPVVTIITSDGIGAEDSVDEALVYVTSPKVGR